MFTVALCLAGALEIVGVGSFPTDGAVVPTNVRPIMFPPGANAEFRWIREDGDVVTLESTSLAGGAFAIQPGPLAPGELVVIETRCDSCVDSAISWRVGDDADDVAPTFGGGAVEDVSILGAHSGGPFPVAASYEVGLTIPSVDEPAKLLLRGADSIFADGAFDTNEARMGVHFFIEGGAERRECYDAVAIDVAGNETVFGEELCFDLTHELMEEPVWCASSRTMPLPLALLGIALATRRRRRR